MYLEISYLLVSKVDTDLSKDIWLGKPLPCELGLFIMGLKPPLLDGLEVGGGGPPLKRKIKRFKSDNVAQLGIVMFL